MSATLTAAPLAQPCRAKQVLSGCVTPDPADGRERLWLTNMNENTGGELIAVDFENDTAELYRWPAGDGSWHVMPLDGGRFAISTYYDGKFLLFDARAKEWLHVADFPEEKYIWDMAVGNDGRIYGGTYPGGKLGAFDPETRDFEDCGRPDDLDEGSLYLRHVVATPDGDIVCSFGYAQQMTAIYKVREKRFVQVWEDDDLAAVVSLLGYLIVSSGSRGLLALAGTDPWPIEQSPLPDCPVAGGWGGIHSFSTDERVYLTVEQETWKWLPGTGELTRIHEHGVRGGTVYGFADDDSMLGVRGQDYFRLRPGEAEGDLRPIPAESEGRPMHFLVAGESGRVWGGPPFGQTVCWYEIDTGEYHNTGQVVDGGGEVYGATEVDGKLYTASYAGADFAVYDPEQPWDQWNHVNPRPIASLRSEGLCRPTGRMRLGPDGKLYSGWQAEYGRYGGALARLDPANGEVRTWHDPLGPEAVGAMTLDDRHVYIGTNLSANGLSAKPGDGHFGVFDIAAEEFVYVEQMKDDPSVRPVGTLRGEDGSRLVIVPVGDIARVFDADALEFRDDIAVETPDSPGVGEDAIHLADGSLVYVRGPWLVRVKPDLSVEHLGPLEHRVEHMTVGSDGSIYYSSGPTLYRLGGV